MGKKRMAPSKPVTSKVVSLAEHREKKRNEKPCNGLCLICTRINECDEFLEELEEEWSEELMEISQEGGDRTYAVFMSTEDGRRFVEVLKETLLFQFVEHTMTGNTMLVSTDKETVSRLMVAELMDLEIDFSFRSMARSGTGS